MTISTRIIEELQVAGYVETLERSLASRAMPKTVAVSPHFEHRIVKPEERARLRQAHLDSIKEINDKSMNKKKVQRDGKGATVERFKLHIDASKSMYEPPEVVATGQVKNVVQVYAEKQGPKRGHWASKNVCMKCQKSYPSGFNTCPACRCRLSNRPVYKDGKRLWIEGQHNYNRQLDPRNPDEAVLGTRLMNQNYELQKCLDPVTKQPITEIDESARMSIGVQRRVYDRASQTEIFDPALRAAAEIIRKKNLNQLSNGAQAGQHPESHK